MALTLDNLAEQICQLPAFPRVLHTLMQNLNDQSVGLNKIASIIASEPAIGAKVIKLANSSAYRRAHEVTSIENATLRLGAQPVHSIVVASFLTNGFPSLSAEQRETFWSHTFTIASLARNLATAAAMEPSSAFTCGMLYNIGDLAILMLAESEQLEEIDELIKAGMGKIDAQKKVLKCDYCHIGVVLGNKWQFPPLFIRCIAQHLSPLSKPPICDEAVLIGLCLQIKEALDEMEFDISTPLEELEELVAEQFRYRLSGTLLSHLGMQNEQVAKIVAKTLISQRDELSALLS